MAPRPTCSKMRVPRSWCGPSAKRSPAAATSARRSPSRPFYIQRAKTSDSLDLYDTLTNREREVFQLAAEGHTNNEIASRLFISPRTVETHRANVMHKLGLRSQTDLVRYALQRGILPMEASMKRHAG
jgi:DNA-binding NarL/FixJ family response regulator